MSTIQTDPDWELDEECPECGEDVYLAAIVEEEDEDGPVRAEMMCGERYYRLHDVPGIPVKGGERGCGHEWVWERDD